MSMNMMEILKGQLGGMVAGQLGKAVGLDQSQAESGIGALLPTILGGLIKQVSTPEGAGKLDQALESDDYDGGMFDNITDMLSGGNAGGISNAGGGVIEMLFGNKVGMIAEIIAKVTGMKSGSATSLLGLIAPLVLSFLGKQKRSLGLDSGGMANLLMSQKDEVAKAMPAGMSSTLGLTSLGFADTPAGRPAATPSAQPVVSSGESGLGKLLIPLAILAAIIFGAYKFLGGGGEVVLPELPEVSVPNVDLGDVEGSLSLSPADVTGKLKDVFGGYTETLSGITDVDSAKSAIPEMEGLNERLGSISGMLDKLPAGMKDTVTGQIGPMVEPITAMLDKVMAIPGVGPILKPVVDAMLSKVSMLKGEA
ncbi:hypothetical protein Pla22_11060 [Rubripirellula amarantea]|uniref:DUF937 domain-containing protein n=1 Tax=Rubripirellula amarantea TaxID=2527999 RepID=A0A5C5WS95_9BACT|nr:DUF937 domain-containing protein [Rubripirellula amarantea]TWT53477.1 hypothetical protein Pla22_11060 [Rubripirellula amarantea]